MERIEKRTEAKPKEFGEEVLNEQCEFSNLTPIPRRVTCEVCIKMYNYTTRLFMKDKKILPKSFFIRPTLTIAEELLGKFLVRTYRGKTHAYMITEVEAYDGFEDKASHAHKKKTQRNEVMFREGGHIYVYLTYGMHYMLNIVTGEKEYPAAVLIRGVKEVSGPGRLTKALNITKALNTKSLQKDSGLWVEDRGVDITKKNIVRTPRIGINYAGEWVDAPYRFVIENIDAIQ